MRNRFDRPRLGELLLEEGLISASRLRQALDRQRLVGGTLGANLLEMGVVDEAELLTAVGRQLETPVVYGHDLARIEPAIIQRLPVSLARRYGVVPFAIRGNTLCLASPQPGDIAIENEIALATSCLTRTFLALDVRVEAALHKHYGVQCPARILKLVERLDRGDPPEPANQDTYSPPAPQPPAREPSPASPGLALLRGPGPRAAFPLPTSPGDPAVLSTAQEPIASRPLGRIQQLLGGQNTGETSAILEGPNTEAVIGKPDDNLGDPIRKGTNRTIQWLHQADDRDSVATILLGGCAGLFRRRLILALRAERVLGWKGDGRGIVPRQLAAVNFSAGTCSPFLSLLKGSEFWLGPLPPGPAAEQLTRVLGGKAPCGCCILPITIGERIVSFLYLDNGDDGVVGAPIAQLLELTRAAGDALARSIAKKKAPPHDTRSSTGG
ncbi:MAG TPA: hypothetical protein VMT85_14580 [Thermoanaerobaculia bacterium]|nr:hypothetical protein [Thermoanaerobaculia bacterium]